MRYKSEFIFILILLPFIGGILISNSGYFTKLNLVGCYFAFIIFIFLFIIRCLYRSSKVYNHKKIIGVLFLIFFFTLGFCFFNRHYSPNHLKYFANIPGEFLLIKIANEPEPHSPYLKFEATVLQVYQSPPTNRLPIKNKLPHRLPCTGKLLIILKTDSLHPCTIKYGEVYMIPVKYTEPDPPYNPGEFDFKSWLIKKNIHQQTFLSQHQMIAVGENKGNPVIRYSLTLRKRQVAVYRRLIKDDEAFAMAATLLLGYRADLSAETLSAYSKTGTIHALSVSGMHVGIIYIVIEWALQFLNRNAVLKIVKALVILLLIWFYTFLTGCSASVLRSAIMLSAFVLAKSWNKNTNSYNILAFSAFCLLLVDPLLLWDVGFQLSYLSVFGLIYLQPKIQGLLYVKWKWLENLWSLICLSLAAQITTFPFSVYYFHQFPIYFIISNLFITLPMTLLMYLGILVLLLRQQWLACIFEWLIQFTNKGLDFLSRLPYSTTDGIWMNKTELALLCLFIGFIITGLKGKNKLLFMTAVTFLLFLQIHFTYDKISVSHQRKIILYSLNKNYAAAFIWADSAIVVSDLKQGDKSFKFFIQPALDLLKVNQVNCIPSGRDTVTDKLVISGHQLRFAGFNILQLDSSFNFVKIAYQPGFDAVWLQYNPRRKMSDLQTEVGFKHLWIDATNKRDLMESFLKDSCSIVPLVLKKRNATIIEL